MAALLKPEDVEIEIEIAEEDVSPRVYFKLSDDAEPDEEQDRRMVEDIEKALTCNLWAWCTARVRVQAYGQTGQSHWIGACSYTDEEDFMRPGGYFENMLNEAIEDLERQLFATDAPASMEGSCAL